jgi:hypothetical protein
VRVATYQAPLLAAGSMDALELIRTRVKWCEAVRSLYNAYYGEDGLKNPTAKEWAAFAASCNLRDMGTHLCALPTGEHCPKGLICLGCARSQRTCRTDRVPRDGDCQDQGSPAESGGIERRRGRCHRTGSLNSDNSQGVNQTSEPVDQC